MIAHSFRKVAAMLLLVLLTVGVTVVKSADDSGWQASYWNNTTLTGSPVLSRTERVIDYNWGESSPAPGTVNADDFSVRWMRTVNLPAGTYRFTLSSDDGARLLIDGQTVLDQWSDHSLRTASAEIPITGGDTQLIVEYYDRGLTAVASFKYTLVQTTQASAAPAPQQPIAAKPAPDNQVSSCSNANWAANYYNNTDLSGAPVLSRTDASINFNWGEASPAAGVNADGFSVRWISNINLRSGSYLIALSGDDGLRLALNETLRVNDWFAQPLTTRTFSLDHAGGILNFRVEHFDQDGFSKIGFSCVRLGDYNGPALETAQAPAPVAQPVVAAEPASAPAPAPVVQPVAASTTTPVESAPAVVSPAAPANGNAGGCQISYVYHLNLREGPSLQTAIVGRVSYGEVATLTGGRHGKYVQIRNGLGQTGWINKYYCGAAQLPPDQVAAQATATTTTASAVKSTAAPVQPAAPACGNTTTVATNALLVRGGPDISYLWYDLVNYGDTLCLTGERNVAATWIGVITHNGIRGWVFSPLTTISSDQLYALDPTQ